MNENFRNLLTKKKMAVFLGLVVVILLMAIFARNIINILVVTVQILLMGQSIAFVGDSEIKGTSVFLHCY